MIDAPGATQKEPQNIDAPAEESQEPQPLMPVEVQDESFVVDWRRLLINCFIVFHLFAICIWNLPGAEVQQRLVGFARPYMQFTGNWQYWGMFSPTPSDTDIYLSAVVHYQNGSKKSILFPRMSQLGWAARYRWERWRKLGENVYANRDANLWPYLARYAAIENNPNAVTNPVVSVDLIRTFRQIPPPGLKEPAYTSYTFSKQFPSQRFLTPDGAK